MRFFATIAAFALAAAVSAQNATATSAALTPQQTCLNACDRSNICCQAACVGVPCPDEAQVNATTQCAAQCHQGNGTEAETAAYAACQSSCISSYFLTATTGTAAATRASGAAATGTSASGSHTGTSAHASSTASNTASGASASATGNSAPETRVALAGAGLFGLLIAGLVL